jgi:hypothetical protein
VSLDRLEIAGDEKAIDDYLGTSATQPLDGIDVEWLDPIDYGTGVVAAVFDTSSGPVRID